MQASPRYDKQSAEISPESILDFSEKPTLQNNMDNKMTKKKNVRKWTPQKSEEAMIQGILEGSPDGIGVAVIRLECGCRKMAAVARDGEPASKVIMFRDQAESICDKCKKDDGAFIRVTEAFIYWDADDLTDEEKSSIEVKVLGSKPTPN
jgi:hypothetical protein